jgi:hypothetical protein
VPQSPNLLTRDPDLDPTVNCQSLGEVRLGFAGASVVFNRINTGMIGNALNGIPRPGSDYTLEYGNGQRESFIAGPWGSPTVAGGTAIPGTCY